MGHKAERRRHRKHANGKEETLRTDPTFPPDGFNGFGPVADSFSGFGDFVPFEPWDRQRSHTWPTVTAPLPVDPPTDTKAREALPKPAVPSCHVDSNLSSGMPSTASQGYQNFLDQKCQEVGKEMIADGCQGDDSFSDGIVPQKSVSSSTIGSHRMEAVVSDVGRFDDAILAALCALPRDAFVHVLRRAAISRPEEMAAVWGPQGQAGQSFLPDALSEQ